MLRIAICDDEKVFTEFLHRSSEKILSDESIEAAIDSFTEAKQLLTLHKHNPYDIIFLDIDMPQISGFDAAESIRKTSLSTFIVFVTSKRELVYSSFEYSPFYFICKSSPQTLSLDIDHVYRKLITVFKQNKLIILQDSVVGEERIAIKDIVYIQSDKHYLLYYIVGENIPIRERNQLKNRMNELVAFDFISPHKRYLVNMHHIKRFDTMVNTILVSNGNEIPISRTAKNTVFEQYRIFRRK